jgi:hypothetical protein
VQCVHVRAVCMCCVYVSVQCVHVCVGVGDVCVCSACMCVQCVCVVYM